MSRFIEKLEKVILPTVALKGFVLFPMFSSSFEVSNTVASKALEAAANYNNRLFIVSHMDASKEENDINNLYSVGVVVKLKQTLKMPGTGTVRVLVEGISRGEAIEYTDYNGYIMAELYQKNITLEDKGGIKGEALVSRAVTVFSDYIKFIPKLANEIVAGVQTITDPGMLADFIAANVLIKYPLKQQILAEFNPLRRLELLCDLMERELEVMAMESRISKKTKKNIDKHQREYFLREQLKVIHDELANLHGNHPEADGEDSEGDDEITEMEHLISKANPPMEVRVKLGKELNRLSKMSFGSPEANVIRNYIEVCCEIPWDKKTKDRLDIKKAREILDADHDGLEKVKDRIIEFLAVKQLSPDLKGQIICLVGPPGVGKTSIGASIARALKRNYTRVSLGGVRDEADIRGHRKTYIGSMPGRIINAITNAKSLNPLIMLDEIDKLTRDAHGDPASALLEVLDGEQNHSFRDHFVELPVDLSDCMFIATANDLDTIPRPLLDRMEVIHIPSYTLEEKVSIAKHHLIPKQLKRHGLTKRSLKINDDAVREIIEHYTKEAGVRNLEREIARLCRRVAKKLIETGEKSCNIRAGWVTEVLERHKYKKENMSAIPLVGVVNGLAWTQLGGELLKAEVMTMPGNGKIELTGSLGDVMKESAKLAVSYIRSRSDELGIKNAEFYKNRDIHIHFPEGAVPKDGPSAGVTMICALVSELTGRAVRSEVAMTGEISLRGNVLPIGGLREKTMAAYTNGIKTVIIPYDNLDDLDEVDPAVKENITFIPARHIDTVIENALLPAENDAESDTANTVSDSVSEAAEGVRVC
ncbi:MAG: endopeptidase La [Ruminococcaceae bacterium]|nr:endopeptidase La [Oscillospiraceae bacterium]